MLTVLNKIVFNQKAVLFLQFKLQAYSKQTAYRQLRFEDRIKVIKNYKYSENIIFSK